MARERPGRASPRDPGAPRSRPARVGGAEVELSDEELLALAEQGVDPDEARQLATEPRPNTEASPHDRDSARDELEGLVAEGDEEY